MKLQKLLIFLPVLLFLSVGCCRVPAVFNEEPEPFCHTVRFYQGEHLLSIQDVPDGQLPQIPDFEIPKGLSFWGWNTEVLPVTVNCDYRSILVPLLNRHAPYLFPREDGLIHPEDSFTGDDLRRALLALAADDAQAYLPAIPDGNITVGILAQVMNALFPGNDVFDPLDPGTVLSRSQAAALMNRLLDRCAECISLAENTVPFLDVSPAHALYDDLMEASVQHGTGSDRWEDICLPTGLTPGWQVESGKTRYIDEYGYPLCSAALPGDIVFDSEGWITSGNDALDASVQATLKLLQEWYPDALREHLLRRAYLYVRGEFFYVNKPILEFGATGWETALAVEALETRKGNCYYYAAAFWALARGLGYEAYAISGELLENGYWATPHGWVEIQYEDGLYYYDPESEIASWNANDRFMNLYHLREEDVSNKAYREMGK